MRIQFFILCCILLSCSKPADQTEKSIPEITQLNANEFSEKIKEDVVLIDVRTPEEYADAHIEGAANLNFQDSDFEKWLDSLDQSKEYALYCAGGGRSSKAADLMKSKGFHQLNNLTDGIKSWKESGLPVVPRPGN